MSNVTLVQDCIVDAGATRYSSIWYRQESTFDIGDRLTKRTTGIDKGNLLPDVGGGVRESAETFAYSARGLPYTIGSSYGTLVSEMKFTASGLSLSARYGDAAQTLVEREYDDRERLRRYRATRASAPSIWSTGATNYTAPGPETTQLDLMQMRRTPDEVDNPLILEDVSTATWPDGARQVSRAFTYDAAYRVRQVDATQPGGPDPYVSPFEAEQSAGDRAPLGERDSSGFRMQQQRFYHDAHGNLDYSDDNEQLTFERSFGEQRNGFTAASPSGAGGPHQFLEGNDALAPTAATYDLAGNLTELTVSRASCQDRTPNCTHRFLYDWDEVGQMVRARRWDHPAGEVPAYSPEEPPTWDLSYAHGFGGRTLTSKTDSSLVTRHTLDVFDTLRIDSVPFNATTGSYTVQAEDERGFLGGGVARVFFDRAEVLPQAGANPTHVYLSIGDHLGSTAFVLDKDSGEVVERAQHQAYGKVESDYRPDRWGANREEFKFTGKEEDIEVGATYFGARFYSPHIGRWLSPDPLTVHGLAADPNPYAYVSGRVSAFVDPFGLDSCGADDAKSIACPGGATVVNTGKNEQGETPVRNRRSGTASRCPTGAGPDRKGDRFAG